MSVDCAVESVSSQPMDTARKLRKYVMKITALTWMNFQGYTAVTHS